MKTFNASASTSPLPPAVTSGFDPRAVHMSGASGVACCQSAFALADNKAAARGLLRPYPGALDNRQVAIAVTPRATRAYARQGPKNKSKHLRSDCLSIL